MPKGLYGLALDQSSLVLAAPAKGGLDKLTEVTWEAGTLLEALEKLGPLLKEAAAAAGLRGGACAVALAPPHVILRRLTFPVLPPEALRLNLEAELAQFLPSAPESYIIRYKLLNREAGKLTLLAAALEKQAAAALERAVSSAGFRLKAIDCAENAWEKLLRLLTRRGVPDLDNAAILTLQPGGHSYITVLHRGRFALSRALPAGAEEPERLAGEASAMLEYAYYSEGRVKLSHLYLAGSAADMAGLAELLSEALSLPVSPIQGILNGLGPQESLNQGAAAFAATLREVK